MLTLKNHNVCRACIARSFGDANCKLIIRADAQVSSMLAPSGNPCRRRLTWRNDRSPLAGLGHWNVGENWPYSQFERPGLPPANSAVTVPGPSRAWRRTHQPFARRAVMVTARGQPTRSGGYVRATVAPRAWFV